MDEIKTAPSMFTVWVLEHPEVRQAIAESVIDYLIREMIEKGVINLTELTQEEMVLATLKYLEEKGVAKIVWS